MFDRFYRRSGSTVSGNGLGLAIARDIATRHAAAIELDESEVLGGLRARVRFPCSTHPPSMTRLLRQPLGRL